MIKNTCLRTQALLSILPTVASQEQEKVRTRKNEKGKKKPSLSKAQTRLIPFAPLARGLIFINLSNILNKLLLFFL
jgi:aryl-alcohol dehydrogenase-like predicted oxidoreductase